MIIQTDFTISNDFMIFSRHRFELLQAVFRRMTGFHEDEYRLLHRAGDTCLRSVVFLLVSNFQKDKPYFKCANTSDRTCSLSLSKRLSYTCMSIKKFHYFTRLPAGISSKEKYKIIIFGRCQNHPLRFYPHQLRPV